MRSNQVKKQTSLDIYVYIVRGNMKSKSQNLAFRKSWISDNTSLNRRAGYNLALLMQNIAVNKIAVNKIAVNFISRSRPAQAQIQAFCTERTELVGVCRRPPLKDQ